MGEAAHTGDPAHSTDHDDSALPFGCASVPLAHMSILVGDLYTTWPGSSRDVACLIVLQEDLSLLSTNAGQCSGVAISSHVL